MTFTETTDDTDLSARIATGRALLDTDRPGWQERLNLRSLDLSDVARCILAQVYGGWCSGLTALWPDHDYREQVGLAIEHGFEADNETYYAALTEAWLDALTGEQS